MFEPTLQSVAAAKRWLKVFVELGYSPEKLQLLLNRAGAKTGGIENDVSTLLAGKEIFKIPNAFQLSDECCLTGQAALLKSPHDKFSMAIMAFARTLQKALASREFAQDKVLEDSSISTSFEVRKVPATYSGCVE